MLAKFPIQKKRAAAAATIVVAIALAGCALNLPPAPASNPADASAPESATAPLRPHLLATSRTFLSARADDREEKAKQMDMSESKQGASDVGAIHQEMKGMEQKPKEAAENYYTCPMHPEVQETKPGNCPICGMTLVKKTPAPEGAKP